MPKKPLHGSGRAAAWEWPEAADKWLLEDMTDIAAVQVPAGDGFWVNAAQTGTITLVGQVPAAAETTINVNPGFNLLSCPYAKDINIQNIKVNGLNGLDEALEKFVTTLKVWTGTGYRTYGYVNAEEAAAWEWPGDDSRWRRLLVLYHRYGLCDFHQVNLGESATTNHPKLKTTT